MIKVFLELLQQKKRTIISAAVLLVLNVLLSALVSGYLNPRVNTSLAKWNELRQRIAVSGKADVATVYRRGTEDLKTLSGRIPAKREFSRVLGELLDSATSNSLSVGTITYKPQTVKDRNLLAYGVSLSVSGTYAGIKSYLGDLQNFDNLIVIEGVGFTNSDLYEENVSMDLRLTMYLQGRDGA